MSARVKVATITPQNFPDKFYGEESLYFHAVGQTQDGRHVHLLLTSQEYTAASTRAERDIARLPQPARDFRTLAIVGLLLLLGLLGFFGSGCASTPSSYLKYGPVTLGLPKDSKWDLLEFTYETNGAFRLVISNASFTMNPAVIDAQTMRDERLINAGANAAGKLGGTAIKTAAGVP